MINTRKGFKLTPTDKDKRIEELERQIEKMKCGQNCKHLYINLCDLNFRTCSNCKDKWEIKENG